MYQDHWERGVWRVALQKRRAINSSPIGTCPPGIQPSGLQEDDRWSPQTYIPRAVIMLSLITGRPFMTKSEAAMNENPVVSLLGSLHVIQRERLVSTALVSTSRLSGAIHGHCPTSRSVDCHAPAVFFAHCRWHLHYNLAVVSYNTSAIDCRSMVDFCLSFRETR